MRLGRGLVEKLQEIFGNKVSPALDRIEQRRLQFPVCSKCETPFDPRLKTDPPAREDTCAVCVQDELNPPPPETVADRKLRIIDLLQQAAERAVDLKWTDEEFLETSRQWFDTEAEKRR